MRRLAAEVSAARQLAEDATARAEELARAREDTKASVGKLRAESVEAAASALGATRDEGTPAPDTAAGSNVARHETATAKLSEDAATDRLEFLLPGELAGRLECVFAQLVLEREARSSGLKELDGRLKDHAVARSSGLEELEGRLEELDTRLKVHAVARSSDLEELKGRLEKVDGRLEDHAVAWEGLRERVAEELGQKLADTEASVFSW